MSAATTRDWSGDVAQLRSTTAAQARCPAVTQLAPADPAAATARASAAVPLHAHRRPRRAGRRCVPCLASVQHGSADAGLPLYGPCPACPRHVHARCCASATARPKPSQNGPSRPWHRDLLPASDCHFVRPDHCPARHHGQHGHFPLPRPLNCCAPSRPWFRDPFPPSGPLRRHRIRPNRSMARAAPLTPMGSATLCPRLLPRRRADRVNRPAPGPVQRRRV